jgi:hypothetical protein
MISKLEEELGESGRMREEAEERLAEMVELMNRL